VLYAGRTDEDGDSSVSNMRNHRSGLRGRSTQEYRLGVGLAGETQWSAFSLPGETIDWLVNENGDFGTDG
jgi:hypothetical protein